jgi:hypothetical protein
MSRNHEYEPPDDDRDEEASDQESTNDSPSVDEQSPGDGPSEKQIRANRENAKKSTGPRTEAGKKRSSQNPTKHGIFKSRLEPVQDGPIGEDPQEFRERTQILVESMQPRDPLETEVATRIVGVLVKLERLDRWSATSIAAASVMKPSDIKAGARSEVTLRALQQAATLLHWYFADPSVFDNPDFETMAIFLRFQGPEAEVSIDGFWDEENTPSGDKEWRRALEALKNALWSSDEEAEAWARQTSVDLSRRLEQVENLEERIAVDRIMKGPFSLQIKYETQLLNSLRVLRREYEELRKRDLS